MIKSLADEILAVLPALMDSCPAGPLAKDVADRLCADLPSVRRAFHEINEAGTARIVRRGRKLHLVPADTPASICIICHCEFKPVARRTVTCSRSCARKLAWRNPDMRRRHSASLKKAKASAAARQELSKRWKEYCARPEIKEHRSEVQRRIWADPVKRAKRTMALEEAWENHPEKRAAFSKRRKRDWQNPDFRAKTIAAMHDSQRARRRRRIVEIAAANDTMTTAEIGALVGRTAKSVEIVLQRARKNGEIGPRLGDGPRLRRKAIKQREQRRRNKSAASDHAQIESPA